MGKLQEFKDMARASKSRSISGREYGRLQEFVKREVNYHQNSVAEFHQGWCQAVRQLSDSTPYTEEHFRQIERSESKSSVQAKFLLQLSLYVTAHSERLLGQYQEVTPQEAGDFIFGGVIPRPPAHPTQRSHLMGAEARRQQEIARLFAEASPTERIRYARMALDGTPLEQSIYKVTPSASRMVLGALFSLGVNPMVDGQVHEFANTRAMNPQVLLDAISQEDRFYSKDEIQQLGTIVSESPTESDADFYAAIDRNGKAVNA